LFFEIAFGITFNIIGTISLSELFLFVFAVFLFFRGKILYLRYPILKKISILYLGLIASQILSETLLYNSFNNASRGIMVSVVSYLHLVFLFFFFTKDKKIILFGLAGIVLRMLIFQSAFEGNLEGVLEGIDVSFLKFYLVYIITIPLLIVTVLMWKEKRKMTFSLIVIGLIIIVLGARSGGLIFTLTGGVAYLVVINKKINRKQLLQLLFIVSVVGYGLYAIYVQEVLSGKIKSGNSEVQLQRVKDPYNPINLIMTGRAETFIGWIAFMDKPILGHGTWAKDPSWKYHQLYYLFNSDNTPRDANVTDVIPAHSVLIAAGMYNGVLAFIFMFSILFFFVKTGFNSLNKRNPYMIIVIWGLSNLVWEGLFGPSSHFRLTMPFYFAVILISHYSNKKQLKKQNEIFTHDSNRNL
jgi:hypothetical protein